MTTSFKEKNPEKVAEFLDILDNLKDLPVVYIDETGVDRYLYRPYARLLERKKSMKRLTDFNCCRTSRRRVYSFYDLQGKYDE